MSAILPARLRNLFWPALLVALSVPLFLEIPQHLRDDPLLGPLGSRYHVALFLIMTLVLYRHGPLAGRLTPVVLACLAFGAVTELFQTVVGRSALLTDWFLNAQGVAMAACWIRLRRIRKRTLLVLGGALLAGVLVWPLRGLPVVIPELTAARARFPLLDDFDRPRALMLWRSHRQVDAMSVPVAGRGRVLEIRGDGQHAWPGVTSRGLLRDWSGHSLLHVDCRLIRPSPDSLQVSVWLVDRAAPGDEEIAVQHFTVGHAWRTLEVPLAELRTTDSGRLVVGREVLRVAVYATLPETVPVAFQIDDMMLVPEP